MNRHRLARRLSRLKQRQSSWKSNGNCLHPTVRLDVLIPDSVRCLVRIRDILPGVGFPSDGVFLCKLL
jgi:hypothetical protein